VDRADRRDRRHFVLPLPVASIVRAVVGCFVMAVVLWPFRSSVDPASLAAQVCGGAALYGAILVAANFIGLRDTLIDRIARRAAVAEVAA
jgi:hypothetical protein